MIPAAAQFAREKSSFEGLLHGGVLEVPGRPPERRACSHVVAIAPVGCKSHPPVQIRIAWLQSPTGGLKLPWKRVRIL